MIALASMDWLQNKQQYLPYLVGFAVAATLLLLLLLRRQPQGLEKPPKIRPLTVGDTSTTDDTYANRRGSARRDGQPVRVMISSPSFRGSMEYGWVLDRSTGGLRIAVSKDLPVASVIQVRAENAPDTIPWVTLIVRSCREQPEHYEAGCAFEQTPPWNVLLLFG
jgi:hypothetical protein